MHDLNIVFSLSMIYVTLLTLWVSFVQSRNWLCVLAFPLASMVILAYIVFRTDAGPFEQGCLLGYGIALSVLAARRYYKYWIRPRRDNVLWPESEPADL